MIFNIELPNKLNKINYFMKTENGCRLCSHNGATTEIFIIVDYDLEIEKDFVISDSTLLAISKLQPDVELKLNDKSIVAVSKKGRYTGKYLTIENINPNIDYKNHCEVNLDVLNKAANYTSTNEKKPILMGVNVSSNSTVVATDGFKVYQYKGNANNEMEGNITISSNLIKMAYSIFENKNIVVEYNKNTIAFKDNNIMVVGRLLDGNYPSLLGIFGMIENEEKKPLDKNEILECLDFTKMTSSNSKMKDLGLYAMFQKNKFIGKSDETFEKEITYDGAEIVFDANYLELVLKTFKGDNIEMATKDNGKGSLACFSEENNQFERIVLLGVAKEV